MQERKKLLAKMGLIVKDPDITQPRRSKISAVFWKPAITSMTAAQYVLSASGYAGG